MRRTHTSTMLVALLMSSAFALSEASAAAFIVTPTDPHGWGPADVRHPGTIEISSEFPRNGDGSLEFNLTGVPSKAGYGMFWSPNEPNTFGTQTTLGKIGLVGFDWLRDGSSTNPAVQQPALKLHWWNDNDSSGGPSAGDNFGLLIWENVYNNGGAAIEDIWQSEDTTNEFFWQWHSGVGANEDFDVTLAQWAAGYTNTDPQGALLSTNTLIYGVSVEAGSGWTGKFQGAADNVSIGFTGGATHSYNFELNAAPIPEPARASILLLGFLSCLGLRRRKK